MTYIFEDNSLDVLCRLFDSVYSESIQSKFIYQNGIGNIMQCVQDCVDSGETEIAVFMDLIPDNPNTAYVYKQLRANYMWAIDKFIIIPVVCREYVYLKQLNEMLQIKDANFKMCLDTWNEKDWYRNQRLLNDAKTLKFCRNFEKFCKLVQKIQVPQCARNIGDQRTCIKYLNDACVCNKVDFDCCWDKSNYLKKDTKVDKFIQSFPCRPLGQRLSDQKEMQWDEVVQLHTDLIDQYNKLVDYFIQKDTNRNVSYKKVKPCTMRPKTVQ